MSSKLPKLSLRLSRLVELTGTSERIWDIGCDHGLAGLTAITLGQFKECFLVDPSLQVVQKLKQILAAYTPGSFSISVLQAKGAELAVPLSNNVFLMAGLGGEQIKETLMALAPQLDANNRFVLSAHRDVLVMRKWLHDSGWTLVGEEVLSEDEREYEILVVETRRGERRVSLYGEEQWKSPAGAILAQKLLDKLSIHQNPADRRFREYLVTLSNRSNFT
jgi:tRNA A22 N-methylase